MEALLSTDLATLPKPRASRNVIYEDRRQVKSVVSRRVHQEDIVNSVNAVITLQRGYHRCIRATLLVNARSSVQLQKKTLNKIRISLTVI